MKDWYCHKCGKNADYRENSKSYCLFHWEVKLGFKKEIENGRNNTGRTCLPRTRKRNKS
jgi:hypothetical protein